MAGNLTGALITGAGLFDQLDRYDEMKDQMQEGYDQLSNELTDATNFTGFTVSGSPFGGAGVGEDGSVNLNMNQGTLDQMNALTGYANDFFGSAAGDQSAREQSMYDAIRATQAPEEARQFSELESRLAAQGRLGMVNSAYGSSPEMFGFHKAVGENMNNASLAAIEQARKQQMQDATIGTQFQNNAYMPQNQMLNFLNSGFQGAQLDQAGDLAGAGYKAQLGSDAMRGGINAEKIRADLMMGLFNTAGKAFSDNEFDPVGSGLSWLWDEFGWGSN